MASVHQKQPVPNVAVSIAVEPELLTIEVAITLISFFDFELLSFCAQELNPIKLTTEINRTFNMEYIFASIYAKVNSIDCITIYSNKSLTIRIISTEHLNLQ